jgi:hypothetical protein
VGDICNPGDRTCGPHPPAAPANKITFSGVGDYTYTTGPKTVKAVFRVDIEDRSEGNSHSSTKPPDRYRIRLWLLDPAIGRNPDPNSAEAMALRVAASADPTKIASLATTEDLKVNIPPDIDDGGEMTQGNHQIHKATGAHCSAPLTLPAAPRLDVSAEVACPAPDGTCTFGVLARGSQVMQDPLFIYRITIMNPGTAILTNLSVWEHTGTVWTDVSRQYFAPSAQLRPNGSVTLYRTNTWGLDTIDTVIVSGQSKQDGTLVTASSTAMASVDLELQLSIRRVGATFVLEWPPSTPPGFVLESTTSLKPPASWSVIASNPSNPFVITNTPTTRARFYRIRMP